MPVKMYSIHIEPRPLYKEMNIIKLDSIHKVNLLLWDKWDGSITRAEVPVKMYSIHIEPRPLYKEMRNIKLDSIHKVNLLL